MVGCIIRAYDVILDHLRRHGDSPLPQDSSVSASASVEVRYGIVEFDLSPSTVPPQHCLSYSDTLTVLKAFSMNMSREEDTTWLAGLFLTEGNVRIEDALIYSDEGGPETS